MKWIRGRQESGYFKNKIISFDGFIKFDIWLLKFPKKSVIKAHIDKVDGSMKHHRVNIILKHADIGGKFVCSDFKVWFNRIIYFRPDKEIHSVTKVYKGCRYVLSIGWLTK